MLNTPPVWLANAIAAATPHVPTNFCGRIEVNFFMGGVTTTNLDATYKWPDLIRLKRPAEALHVIAR